MLNVVILFTINFFFITTWLIIIFIFRYNINIKLFIKLISLMWIYSITLFMSLSSIFIVPHSLIAFYCIYYSIIFIPVYKIWLNLIITKLLILFIGVYQSMILETWFQNTMSHINSTVINRLLCFKSLRNYTFLHNVQLR